MSNGVSQFLLILNKIYKLLDQIKLCKTVEEADRYFSVLADIQGNLAILVFEKGIELPQELMKIVTDCDRLDDKIVRDFLFSEIKKGTYSLKSDKFLWY